MCALIEKLCPFPTGENSLKTALGDIHSDTQMVGKKSSPIPEDINCRNLPGYTLIDCNFLSFEVIQVL